MLQRNAFVNELDVKIHNDLALSLTVTALLIVAVEEMDAFAMAIVASKLVPKPRAAK
jgi:hypothetical protein